MSKNTNNANKNLPNLGKAYEELNASMPTNVPTANLLGLNEVPIATPAPEIPSNLQDLFTQQAFEAGIFLDNDPRHRASVASVCGGKFTIPVVSETPFFRNTVRIESPQYVQFLLELSEEGKKTARLLSRLCLNVNKGYEAIDSRSGIDVDVVHKIMTWVDENRGKRLVAVFDFDRTLSIMEGGFFLASSIQAMKKYFFEIEQITKLGNGSSIAYLNGKPIPYERALRPFIPEFSAEGYANYLAGGTERMKMLEEMFDYLYENNVKVIVLTNNGSCSYARNLFREITMVYTKGRPVEVICGVDFGGDKGKAVMGKPTNIGNVKALRDMCVSKGGKHKSRKQKRKARQTRRR
jgi:hypothetical protein